MEKLKYGVVTEDREEPADRKRSDKKGPKALIVSLFIVLAMFLISGNLGPDKRVTQAALDSGVEAHLKGDLETARSLYLTALEREPNNKFAHYNLGLLAQKAGDPAEAEARYGKAMSVDPFFLPAIYNLAVLKENLGENQRAAELYRRAIEVHPNHAAPHFRLGVLLGTKLSQPEEGGQEILKAALLDPRIAEMLRGAAQPQPPQKR